MKCIVIFNSSRQYIYIVQSTVTSALSVGQALFSAAYVSLILRWLDYKKTVTDCCCHETYRL